MKKEKTAENLEKQGRGLTIFLKILGVILLILVLLLLDREFVPWGETWEEMKLDRPEETAGMTDKELWEAVKDMANEEEILPFKSGFLCWGTLLYAWNRQKAEEAEREKLLRQADENAKAVMATVNEFLAENGIKTDSLMTIRFYFHHSIAYLDSWNPYSWDDDSHSPEGFLTETEEEKLKEYLLEAVHVSEEAAAQAHVLGEKCTAAAFAFGTYKIKDGLDYPYLDENGHFDTKRLMSIGTTNVAKAGWLIRYVDEIMLEGGEAEFAYDEQVLEEFRKETLFWQDVKKAERVMTIISRFLSENGIETDSLATVSIYFHDNGIFLDCRDYHSDEKVLDETEKEKLTDLLLENTSVSGDAAAQAYILGEKCTAAAFASKVESITEGTDYPVLGENGQFNTKWRWYGYAAGYTDETLLEKE